MGEEILKQERMGFQLVGFVGDPEDMVPQCGGTGRILGGYPQVEELIRANRVRRLVVAITERRGGYPVDSLLNLRVGGCKVTEWASYYEKLSGRIPVDNLSPSYFIFQEGFSKSRALLVSRRIVSLSFAAGLLLLLFPLLILTAIVIKIDSPGPVFYTQKRVGNKGKVFDIIKFRSMRVDAEQNGRPQWAVRNDPRVTRVGKFIRATRLDELPQLINVLRGDLDFVGPRPERPKFVEELSKLIPYYTLRHTVKPGLTGWAQVMFFYSGTIEESKKKLQYDLFYIKNMSIKLDFLVLFRTIKIVLLGRGAL
jgi:sugar transferase (PEP-CTERM system associated)